MLMKAEIHLLLWIQGPGIAHADLGHTVMADKSKCLL